MWDTSKALQLVTTRGPGDYALIDSGRGRKLERFGALVVDRPEPQALWRPSAGEAEWRAAHAMFSGADEDAEKGRWRLDKPVPDFWPVRIAPGDLPGSAAGMRPVTMRCRLAGLWHLGLFPEQLPHWQWMLQRLSEVEGETPRVLNLFGYTGAASLLAAAAGAHVTHVDASRKAVQWGKENQEASGLSSAPVRWLVDDARKLAAREVRRGKSYHMILVDPPKFGRGPEGEVWNLFDDIAPLLADCERLLAKERSALVLTAYAIRASSIAFAQLVREQLKDRSGSLSSGELALVPRAGGHLVPTSLFARWASA